MFEIQKEIYQERSKLNSQAIGCHMASNLLFNKTSSAYFYFEY